MCFNQFIYYNVNVPQVEFALPAVAATLSLTIGKPSSGAKTNVTTYMAHTDLMGDDEGSCSHHAAGTDPKV